MRLSGGASNPQRFGTPFPLVEPGYWQAVWIAVRTSSALECVADDGADRRRTVAVIALLRCLVGRQISMQTIRGARWLTRRTCLVAVLLACAPFWRSAQAQSLKAVLELRRLLTGHDWLALEHNLDLRRARAAADSRAESDYVFAFDALVSADPALQGHLDAWVAARPTAVLPRVARGLYFVQMAAAAHADSGDPARQEATNQRARMLFLARADARAAMRLDAKEPMSYMIPLYIIPFERDSAGSVVALNALVAIWPATLHGRAAFFEQLTPRVGNPLGRMAQFTDSAQQRASENPRLRVLRGMPAFERARVLAWDRKHESAIGEYSRALAYGEYWQFRYERGMEYFRIRSLPMALIDLNRALAERPGYVPALAYRALVLAHIAQQEPNWRDGAIFRRAQSDLARAIALDPQNEEVVYLMGDSPAMKLRVARRADTRAATASGDAPASAMVATARAPSAPAQTPNEIVLLHRLLMDDNFRQLDSALAARAVAARSSGMQETIYTAAFDVFATPDTALRVHLDGWVLREATNARARAARAVYFVARAEAARSYVFADSVKAEQWRGMKDWLTLALADAAQAARLDEMDIMAHGVMIDALRMSGYDSAAVPVLRDALRRQPGSLFIRMKYMSMLRPRWGGSVDALKAFASAEQHAAHDNPRIALLQGMVAFDRGEQLRDDDQYQAAVAEYTKALAYGDSWRYRLARAHAYLSLEETEKALADLNRAIAERPGYVEALASRANAFAQLAERTEGPVAATLLRRAREDMRMAMLLDSGESTVRWVRENYPSSVDVVGGDRGPNVRP